VKKKASNRAIALLPVGQVLNEIILVVVNKIIDLQCICIDYVRVFMISILSKWYFCSNQSGGSAEDSRS
jgi:hypothetical protein